MLPPELHKALFQDQMISSLQLMICSLTLAMLSLLMIPQLFHDPHNCLLQKAADYLVSWTNVNGMVINTSKTQEMVVYFGKQLCVDDIPLIYINGSHIKRVVSFKLLGVVISSDLTCDAHVSYILSDF